MTSENIKISFVPICTPLFQLRPLNWHFFSEQNPNHRLLYAADIVYTGYRYNVKHIKLFGMSVDYFIGISRWCNSIAVVNSPTFPPGIRITVTSFSTTCYMKYRPKKNIIKEKTTKLSGNYTSLPFRLRLFLLGRSGMRWDLQLFSRLVAITTARSDLDVRAASAGNIDFRFCTFYDR